MSEATTRRLDPNPGLFDPREAGPDTPTPPPGTNPPGPGRAPEEPVPSVPEPPTPARPGGPIETPMAPPPGPPQVPSPEPPEPQHGKTRRKGGETRVRIRGFERPAALLLRRHL